MPYPPANLVHTDEGALVESMPSEAGNGSPEPGTRSSAVEHALHTGGVTGSIPVASTIPASRRSRKQYVTRPPRIEGDLAIVPLTRGYEAIVDAADADLVGQWNWAANSVQPGCVYASRHKLVSEGGGGEHMHRLLVGGNAPRVDHINGDTLDNRRANLRPCSHKQNMRNHKVDRRNKVGASGVTLKGQLYYARIVSDGIVYLLGRYESLAEAAAAYEGASRVLWGEFAPAHRRS